MRLMVSMPFCGAAEEPELVRQDASSEAVVTHTWGTSSPPADLSAFLYAAAPTDG